MSPSRVFQPATRTRLRNSSQQRDSDRVKRQIVITSLIDSLLRSVPTTSSLGKLMLIVNGCDNHAKNNPPAFSPWASPAVRIVTTSLKAKKDITIEPMTQLCTLFNYVMAWRLGFCLKILSVKIIRIKNAFAHRRSVRRIHRLEF